MALTPPEPRRWWSRDGITDAQLHNALEELARSSTPVWTLLGSEVDDKGCSYTELLEEVRRLKRREAEHEAKIGGLKAFWRKFFSDYWNPTGIEAETELGFLKLSAALTNLIDNGGMSRWNAGVTLPDGWTATGTATRSRVAVRTGGRVNHYSLKMVTAGSTGGVSQTLTNIKPGIHTLAFWLYSDLAGSSLTLTLLSDGATPLDYTHTFAASTGGEPTGVGGWFPMPSPKIQGAPLCFEIPSDATTLTITFTNGQNSQWRLGDVQFGPGPYRPPDLWEPKVVDGATSGPAGGGTQYTLTRWSAANTLEDSGLSENAGKTKLTYAGRFDPKDVEFTPQAANPAAGDPLETTTMWAKTSDSRPYWGAEKMAYFSDVPSVTPSALTRVDDTNVTLTLGGTPATALLQAVSLTLGWTGTLAIARGGTGSATAADARTALGLAIGSDIQAYDADLTTLGAGGSGARDFLGLGTGDSPTFTNLTASGWLRVGTATDTATAGDLVAGLTGAARLFFDQSAQVLSQYDSGGTLANRLSTVAGTASVFNDNSVDIDHRFESNGDANLLFLDGGADSIGIGTASPTAFLHLKAGTTAAASLRFPASTAPTSPNEGDSWNDSTQQAHTEFTAGIKQNLVGCIFSQVADGTVGGTGTETTLINTTGAIGTLTLPANFWTIGKTVRIRMAGHMATAGTGAQTLTVRLKFGSTSILTTAAMAAATLITTHAWSLDLIITCRTTGGTGTLYSQSFLGFVRWGSATAHADAEMFRSSAVTVDTTAATLLDVTADWNSSVAGDTISCTNLTIEVLN